MLKSISIHNFKLHAHTDIKFGGLTILTGINGMGKSTILQALLLLRQSFLYDNIRKGLNLRGELADLGVSGSLACQSEDSNELRLKVDFSDCMHNYVFEYPEDPMETYLPLMATPEGIEPTEFSSVETLKAQGLFNSDFQYISAFRFGPMKSYSRDSAVVSQEKQISKLQGKCEYTIHFLYQYGATHILPNLALQDALGNTNPQLLAQTELWLQKISPKIHLKIEPSGEDFKLNYKFDRQDNLITAEMSAVNTGFGISYLLPIIVAILSAKPGALILIENPEAHVHPKGQSILMELVCIAVKQGIQIIIETHSDHIINGALVNIKRRIIDSEDVQVYFSNRDEHLHTAQTHQLSVTSSGQIIRPPRDFFDQMRIDLRVLTGLSD